MDKIFNSDIKLTLEALNIHKCSRLDKYLVECGVGSRSEIKQILLKKLIRVNGKITTSSKEHVDELKDEVYFMECKWNPCMCAERIYGFF